MGVAQAFCADLVPKALKHENESKLPQNSSEEQTVQDKGSLGDWWRNIVQKLSGCAPELLKHTSEILHSPKVLAGWSKSLFW